MTELMPRSQIDVNLVVLQSDGGVRAAAMNAAVLALADAGVVEALRHIHDTSTIWVRQQHARLTLNAIESALNSALGRRLRSA